MFETISLKQYPPNMSHIGRDVKLFEYCHGRHLQNDVAFLAAHSNSHPLREYSLKSWNPAVQTISEGFYSSKMPLGYVPYLSEYERR